MQLRELADEEVSKLKSSIPNEASPSTSACDPSFPEDQIDDINT
jgi:hypothetical protein